jgi:undecaprenyl-diphosphatase
MGKWMLVLLIQAIILAVIQGITEFLPISSSAHLALAPWLLGWKDQGLTFDIALHFGTLAAVLIYFFRDWVQVTAQGLGLSYRPDPQLSKNPMLLWMLAAASLPIGIFGYLFQKQAETTWRNPFLIGGMLVGVGILMAIGEAVGSRHKRIGQIGIADSLAIGVAQALAIIPGTSRSGITITAGLFRGIERGDAARFSFLLSTPAIAAAGGKAFYDLLKAGGIPAGERLPFAVGIAVSALTGCLAIKFFLRFLRSNSLRLFIAYRIIFGIIVIALAVFFRHPAE